MEYIVREPASGKRVAVVKVNHGQTKEKRIYFIILKSIMEAETLGTRRISRRHFYRVSRFIFPLLTNLATYELNFSLSRHFHPIQIIARSGGRVHFAIPITPRLSAFLVRLIHIFNVNE